MILVYIVFRFNVPNAKSNMAIMNIGVPSGFEAQKDGIEGRPFVKRAELSGGRLNIYFDEVCLCLVLVFE